MPAKTAAKRKAEKVEEVQVKELKHEIQANEAVVAPVAETKDAAGPSPAVVSFLNLLQQAPETKEACIVWFRACADALLNNFELVVAGNKVFRFVEIEFYYNDHNVHQDTFIHGSELQLKTAGHWYFHTAGASSTAYKGGTYKGLDITFGTPGKNSGGMLLRAMEESSTKAVIEGPCMLVDRLLKETQKESILDLVKTGFNLCVTDVNPYMYIRPAKNVARAIVGSPRVGLTLKRFDTFKPTFIMMPYRMTSLTQQIKKNRNTIIMAAHAQGRSVSEIVAITGAKKANVEDFIKQLSAAASSTKVPSDWNGANLNTEGLVTLFAACQRAGAV